MTKKLYYEDEEGEFYWVKETPKTFTIEWHPKLQSDGTPLDQNVDYKELKVSKEKNIKHCLSSYDEEHICIYPFQNGQPFYLTPATIEDIEKEIKSCKEWGVSSEYYEKLRQSIT